jgi:hypothetical protein
MGSETLRLPSPGSTDHPEARGSAGTGSARRKLWAARVADKARMANVSINGEKRINGLKKRGQWF